MVRAFSLPFLAVYALVTLFPFYVLFVRTFVSTQDAAELYLRPPMGRQISLDAEIGNLAIYYDLDIRRVKEDLGIPLEDYLSPRMTLRQIAQAYGIPADQMEAYFAPLSRFGGWNVLFSRGELWRPLVRTVLITLASLVGLNLLSILTGCGLAGLRRTDQMVIYNLYMLQMVIPSTMIILPQFLIVRWLLKRVPDSTSPGFERYVAQIVLLICVNIRGGALSTMLFTSYIGGIPQELEEAATMDGATRVQYLQLILAPLLKVPVASMTVIALPRFWNQFLEPYVYLDLQNHTLLPLIQTFSGQYSTNYAVVYTAIFVSLVPLVMLYVVFHRAFIRGVLAGTIRG